MSRTINTMPPEVQRKEKGGSPDYTGWPPNMGWNKGSLTSFRRSLVRQERAKANQLVREGRYDDIEPFVRNAEWLYW